MSAKAKAVKITQVKSGIGNLDKQKRTLKALGIIKMGHSAVQNDTPCIRGMIKKVEHLITVEEVVGE